jgi:hypothetical protein
MERNGGNNDGDIDNDDRLSTTKRNSKRNSTSFSNFRSTISVDNNLLDSRNSVARPTFMSFFRGTIRISEFLPERVVPIDNITKLIDLYYILQKIIFSFIVFLTLIWISLSAYLTTNYSYYTFSYGFSIASTFLSGFEAGYIMMLFLSITILFVYSYLCNFLPLIDSEEEKSAKRDLLDSFNEKLFRDSKSLRFVALAIVTIIDLIAMILLNSVYVFATINFRTELVFIIEILVSFFKIIWKWTLFPLLTRRFKKYLINDNNIGLKQYDDEVIYQCSIGVINNLIIPLLVSAAIPPNCFVNALSTQAAVESVYYVNQCQNFHIMEGVLQCTKFQSMPEKTTYEPPFDYTYQCSSTIASTYSSIYIIMSILLVVTDTIIIFSMNTFYKKMNKSSSIFKFIDNFIPNSMKPYDFVHEKVRLYKNTEDNDLSFSKRNKLNDNHKNLIAFEINTCSSKEEKNEKIEISTKKNVMEMINNYITKSEIVNDSLYTDFSKVNFNQTVFVVNIVSFFTIIVTVGVIIPIVGIICSICLYFYIHITLSNMGEILNDMKDNDEDLLEQLTCYEANCYGKLYLISLKLFI